MLSLILPLAVSSLATGATEAPAGQFKCLGDTLASCKKIIERRYEVAGGDFEAALAATPKFDVSGKKLPGPNSAWMVIKVPNSSRDYDLYNIKFRISDDGIIQLVAFELPANPASARTEVEFDETKIYLLSSLIMPDLFCAYNEKNTFYRFFYEKVRPIIRGPNRDGFVGVDSASDEYAYDSPPVVICGAIFSYRRNYGVATAFMKAENPFGRFDNIRIGFSLFRTH